MEVGARNWICFYAICTYTSLYLNGFYFLNSWLKQWLQKIIYAWCKNFIEYKESILKFKFLFLETPRGPQGSDRPKQCFTVLPEPNRTSQLKFCFPNRNRTEPNMWKVHKNLDLNSRINKQTKNSKVNFKLIWW